MNFLTLGIGIAVACYSIASGILRFIKPSMFSKLELMKERWGEKAGSIAHFIFYVILPAFIGIAFIIAGINGIAFYKLI